MADNLELNQTVPALTGLNDYVWWTGAFDVIEGLPFTLDFPYFQQSVNWATVTSLTKEQFEGKDKLIPVDLMPWAAETGIGIKSELQYVASQVDWVSKHPNRVWRYETFDNGKTSLESNYNVPDRWDWGLKAVAPYIGSELDMEGVAPDPPGVLPPCDGGGGSERPDYGMIYPRKV